MGTPTKTNIEFNAGDACVAVQVRKFSCTPMSVAQQTQTKMLSVGKRW